MLKLRRLARKNVGRRIGAGIVLLTVTSVVLLSSVIWLFVGLSERETAVLHSVREDAVWAAFQTDREASRLVEAVILARDSGELGDLGLRFDLLYSRVSLLGNGSYAIPFGKGSTVGPLAAEVSRRVIDLTPHIDAVVADPSTWMQSADTVVSLAQAIRSASGDMLNAANAAVNGLRLAERDESLATYWQIGASVAGLTSALVLIVVLLGLQLRHISRTGREILLLSERNARNAKLATVASKAKTAFLATMSHEIRTPLNGIIGVADLLRGEDLTAHQRQQVDIIRQSGDMLLDVITDVLDFSKLEAGAVRFEPVSVELGEVFVAVDKMLRPRAEAAGLQFDITYPSWMVTADANRIRQVLVNLIGNAIKFTEAGSVAVRASLVGEILRVEVVDSGSGIASEDVQLLFREFSQIDSSNDRAFGGSGLGLAICKRLVEVMNGRIGVDSTIGSGSTFWFEVPAGPAEPLAASGQLPVMVLTSTALTGTVLVVDDNQINRDVAAGVLRRLGLAVVTAQNGQDAIDLIAQRSFDLVLMDMQMPRLDGLAATRLLRSGGCTTPIVGVTANAFASDRDACIAAGMNEHLAKPVTADRLRDVLGRYLAQTNPAVEVVPTADIVPDRAYQATLREALGAEDFDALLQQFAASTGDMLGAAEAAVAHGDNLALDQVLHTLKGAAQTMGYPSIAETAQSLRATDARIVDLTDLRAQCGQLPRAAA